MTSVIATAPRTDERTQATRLSVAGSTPAMRAPSRSTAAARRASPNRVRRERTVSSTPRAAATRMVPTELRATPTSNSPAHGGGRNFGSEPHSALTPARRKAEQPSRATSAGTICSRRPRVMVSQTSPRPAATATATARALHQPRPDPIAFPGAMSSPWSTAATVPMATMATLGTRAA